MVGVDATAVAIRSVVGNGAAIERQLARAAAVVIVEDAAALLCRAIPLDGAGRKRCLAVVLDASALSLVRLVVADSDVGRREDRALRDHDATSAFTRNVAGKRSARYVDGAPVQIDARAFFAGDIVVDGRTGNPELPVLRVHANTAAAIVQRLVFGNSAVRDGRVVILQVQVYATASIRRVVVGDIRIA